LWNRLTTAAAQDREAVAVALGGPLKSAPAEHSARQLKDLDQLISGSRSPLRDALIESASLLPEQQALQFFPALLSHSADSGLNAKVAEALAGRSAARAALMTLSQSEDARVRANAVWSLGDIKGSAEEKLLQTAISDADPAVAANAVAALSRTMPASPELGHVLCGALIDPRPYVRANALVGLRHAKLRCNDGREAASLTRDPNAVVRKAAAELLSSPAGSSSADDKRALVRCHRYEVDVEVAQSCEQIPHGVPHGSTQASGATAPVTVFVIPAGLTAPVANAPFALVRADGFVRCGWTDSRGALFEPRTPPGRFSLAAPPQALERN
jgi:HEAT repeat protein